MHSLINSLGIINPNFSRTRRIQVVTPRKATFNDLAVYHTRDYLEIVLSRSETAEYQQTDAQINQEFGLEDVSRKNL